MDSANFLPPAPAPWSIRPFNHGDRAALLQLNAGSRPAVAAVDDAALTVLLAFEGLHFVAVDRKGEVVGYVMSFPRDSGYHDTEIDELRQRLAEPFFYICHIVIAPEFRRQRIGRAFYQRIEDHAERRGVRVLCCDVNTNPPNPESFAFHRRQGFVELGRGIAGNGTAIMYLVRRWGGSGLRPAVTDAETLRP